MHSFKSECCCTFCKSFKSGSSLVFLNVLYHSALETKVHFSLMDIFIFSADVSFLCLLPAHFFLFCASFSYLHPSILTSSLPLPHSNEKHLLQWPYQVQVQSLFPIKIYTCTSRNIKNNKETKYGGKDRKTNKAWWLTFPEKGKKSYITAKQPHNKVKQDKKIKQRTVLKRKKLLISWNKGFQILIPKLLNGFWAYDFFLPMEFQRMGSVIQTEWSKKCFLLNYWDH